MTLVILFGKQSMDHNDYIQADAIVDDNNNFLYPEGEELRVCQGHRKQAYDIGQQLDCLWHDIDNGLFGETAKTGEFYQYVASIKTAIPKPTSEQALNIG